MNPSPRSLYDARLIDWREQAARLARQHTQLSRTRLVTAALAAVLALAWLDGALHWGAAAAVALVFAVEVLVHERLATRLARAELCVEHYRRGLDRIDGRWQGRGNQELLADPDHPYAADLDLFGEGSLFELLCTARTRGGVVTLASWLERGSQRASVVQDRQEAVRRLRPRVDLRQDLAVLAEGVRSKLHPEALIAWAEARAPAPGLAVHVVAASSSLVLLGAVSAVAAWGIAPTIAAMVGMALIYRLSHRRWRAGLEGIDRAERELAVLETLIARFEREELRGGRLDELRVQLGDGRASAAIGALRRRVAWLEWQRNALFLPIALVLCWPVHLGASLQRWRAVHGEAIGRWLEALGELEALMALATYAYERPHDPFAELVDEGAFLEAYALGHPLLEAGGVRNDVALGAERAPGWLISGSNMSGKSTLLRSVGINVVLAWAGAPVCAEAMRLGPLRLGATMRVQDSLARGASRFYAELTKLKTILTMSRSGEPTLCLIDEILAGTNSRDRHVGASALIAQLLEAGALVLVTTHDLAIADGIEARGASVRNVHFVDHLDKGELQFDYQLREGKVTRSNALDWMRAVGLDIDPS